MLTLYLDVGYSDIDAFWEMTLPEVELLIDSASRRLQKDNERHKAELKECIIVARNQAMQTVEGIATLFDKKYKPRKLDDYYPGLFNKDVYQGGNERVMDGADYGKLFMMYAYQRNAARQSAGKKFGDK